MIKYSAHLTSMPYLPHPAFSHKKSPKNSKYGDTNDQKFSSPHFTAPYLILVSHKTFKRQQNVKDFTQKNIYSFC